MDNSAPPQFSTAEFEPELVDSNAFFIRGLLFGVGGALLGLILYSGVGIITGYIIGFVSLAVGWIVAKAILFGSKNRTGLRYQVAAVLLTYAAVSLSAVPIAISQFLKIERELAAGVSTTPATAGSTAEIAPVSAPALDEPDESELVRFWPAMGQLVWLGLQSPFLELQDMPGGLISLLILAIGLQIAWKTTGGTRAAVREVIAGSTPGSDDKPTSLDLGR